MSYYDLTKEEREILKNKIKKLIKSDIEKEKYRNIQKFYSDDDTYIRKNSYLATGKLYKNSLKLRNNIIFALKSLFRDKDEKVRQTVIYALGEIGKVNFKGIEEIIKQAFTDTHHSVLNAVTGALKQLGEKNTKPTLEFIKNHLQHTDIRIRVKLLHGLELRGRTHPDDILPILAEYQNDSEKKVLDMIIHILGQISYKEGCLEKVIRNLKEWENLDLVNKILKEIVNVHKNYSKFSHLSPDKVKDVIKKEFDNTYRDRVHESNGVASRRLTG